MSSKTSSKIQSLPSRAGVFVVDAKEVKNISLNFVYVKYSSEESQLLPTTGEIVTDISNIGSDISSYVEVAFDPPELSPDMYLTLDKVTDSGITLENERIFTENDFGGNVFTGVRTFIPDEISLLRNLITESTQILVDSGLENINTSQSATEFIRSFAQTANSSGFLFSRSSKAMLDRFFQNLSNENLNRSEEADNTSFLGYSFNSDYNSRFLNDISRTIYESATSVFSNAVAEVQPRINDIVQSANITTSDPSSNLIPISNYYPTLNQDHITTDAAIISQIFPNNAMNTSINAERYLDVKLVGYRAKIRILTKDGDLIDYDPVILEDSNLQRFYVLSTPYESQVTVRVEPLYAILIPTYKSTFSDYVSYGAQYTQVAVLFLAGTGKSVKTLTLDTIPPPPPQDLLFNLTATGLEINWSLPFNVQADICKFRIFRRESINEPFTLLRQIDFSPNDENEIPAFLNQKVSHLTTFFEDKTFSIDSKYIYAICCVDMHGLVSNYSEQIEVKINPVFNRLETKLIARIGSFLQYPNMNIEEEIFDDVVKCSGYNSMKVYFNPDFLKVTQEINGTPEDLVNLYPDQNKRFRINLINIDLQKKQDLDILIREGIDISEFDSLDSAVIRSFLENLTI